MQHVNSRNNNRENTTTALLSLLAPLEKGDAVRFKKDPPAAWTRGTVIRKHEAPRSYVIKGEKGTEYRRNRRHLRKTREHQADPDSPDIDDPQDPIPQPTTNAQRNDIRIPIAPNPPQLKTSRYGRRINRNSNYKT